MSQAVLVAVLQMLLGFLQAVSYALLVFWAFGVVKSFPWDEYFSRVRFYHLLIPALALAGMAFVPLKFLLDLLFSFPLDFSAAWIPPLLKFLEGLGFLGLLVYLCFASRKTAEGVEGAQEVRGPKKIWIGVAAAAVILTIVGGGYHYFSSRGYVFKFSLSKPEYLDYKNLSPGFGFSYPSKFVLDKDEEGRFGNTYLIGIKLPSDNRVGCDVRAATGKLNLQGDLEEITAKLAQDISQGAKGFEVINSSLVKLSDEEGIKLEIVFTGPLGETMRTDQVFAAHGDKVYTLICGATKGTYEFFAEDFSYFLDSFSWK